jgi:hypothetical protein
MLGMSKLPVGLARSMGPVLILILGKDLRIIRNCMLVRIATRGESSNPISVGFLFVEVRAQ